MSTRLKILVVEPFYADSHAEWLDGFMKHSTHEIFKLTLPGRHWKWRMHGAAITLAKDFADLDFHPDLIICSDMLDVTTFISLLRRKLKGIPIAMYFHENQISYPWSPHDEDIRLKRDRHYGFINYSSAFASDKLFFNSAYHKRSFIEGLGHYLKAYPDYKNIETINEINRKSEVLYLGMDIEESNLGNQTERNKVPVVLWNHRWEFDKNPNLFFDSLFNIKMKGIPFELIITGKKYKKYPEIFDLAERRLEENILHWGYAKSKSEYINLLKKSDALPVTSIQEFFGISVVEAISYGAYPILPNRLSYPEHIVGNQYFYDNDEDFQIKLSDFLENWPESKTLPNLSKIESYNWKNMIQIYDNKFNSLVEKLL